MRINLQKCLFAMGVCLLAGCGNIEKEIKPVREEQLANQTMTTGRIDYSVYQSVLQDGTYQTSPIRGLTASGLQNGYNQKNFERGLLRLSHQAFSAEDFYFKEGQALDEATVKAWLGRESEDNPLGLNTADSNTPLVFQQLLAYDFIKADGNTLGGVSLGFSFNRSFTQDGTTIDISREAMMKQVHRSVSAVLTRMRKIAGYENIPIQVNIFEQAPANQLTGGQFIYTAISEAGGQSIDEYEEVTESVLLLPVFDSVQNLATDKGINQSFLTFKKAVQKAFPDLVGVTGFVYFVEEEVVDLTIKIDSKYFGQSEIASFTQFIGKQVEVMFAEIPGNVSVEVSAVHVPQAVITRPAGSEQVTSHIFE